MKDDLIDLYVNFEYEVGKFHFETLFPTNFLKYTHLKTKINDLPNDFEQIRKHVLRDYACVKQFIEFKGYSHKQSELIFKKLDAIFEKYQGIPWHEFVIWVKRNENGHLTDISKDIVDKKTLVQIKEHIEGIQKSIVQEYLKIRYEILEPKISISEFNEKLKEKEIKFENRVAKIATDIDSKISNTRLRKLNSLKNYQWKKSSKLLDKMYKNLIRSNFIEPNQAKFETCFNGKEVHENDFIKCFVSVSHIIYFVYQLMERGFIDEEIRWKIERLQLIFRDPEGNKFENETLRNMKKDIVTKGNISHNIVIKINAILEL